MTPDQVFDLVKSERARQAAQWGGPHAWGAGDCSSRQVSRSTKLAVLMEEVGEAAKAHLEIDPDGWLRELVQVAAVAFALLEGLEP